ncbi:glycoside hydrolase family 13 protein [Parathielavia hyrcaniae]|uniref:Glycoside hydrolase family 13 protein n=1 Tax=Parathielavia hyrcaniae TaxID=113614 RepID=A0AAN6PVX0_9PEZI|nr:glycoside hydrolase family 13 protein [Parathielavia hyrcaniae]
MYKYPVDLLNERHERFVLWVPRSGSSAIPPPVLVIGTASRNLDAFQEIGRFPLALAGSKDQGIRLFTDVVMAFGHDPYSYIDFDHFHIRPTLERDNPDSYQSHVSGQLRDGYGGNSWRYIRSVRSYDPETGADATTVNPAWAFHRCHLARWMMNFGLDSMGGTSFSDGAQAVNYITSHDIEGYRKERLYNFLVSNGIWDVEKRAKLAFALLLTSVGIPMIFAGEEFADQMDRSVDMGKKQSDPVNYSRKNDGGWRQALFGYVATLVKFRTKCPALGEDDTDFFHVDGSPGGKIMAWRRGRVGDGRLPVVVVANFDDENTPGKDYFVPNWPDRDQAGWREVSQGRHVPADWVGREPLMAWEAKIYTRWSDDA